MPVSAVLCCVNAAAGEVSFRNISESRATLHTLQHSCSDCVWEDQCECVGRDVKLKLLLDSQCVLRLYEVDPHHQELLLCERSSDSLLQCVQHKHAASGLSVVLFCVTQDELLNRLMVFGTAGTVDSLCHLNAWGRLYPYMPYRPA